MSNETVARWESKSGKHWVELRDLSNEHGPCYCYVAPSQGGTLAAKTYVDAHAEMTRRVKDNWFQPDANKTPMSEVYSHGD